MACKGSTKQMLILFLIVIIITATIITQFLNTSISLFDVKHIKTRKIYELKAWVI